MVYSNDEVQDKLNNSSNSNADARAVRDLSASNDKNAKEESNKAKQEMLIEEAVENNEAFKRLRQTLYKTTSGKVQVSAEDIVEIYSSLVSPSANTVGDKGAFFVDDGLITAAVGAMCYDISVEENGVVLNVDGTLNIEATKHQVAMISGNVPRDEMDKYKAGMILERQQFLEFEKSKNEILSDRTLRGSKAERFNSFYRGMSKKERDEFMNSDAGRKSFEEALNDEKFDSAVEFFRKLGNLETADEVTFMQLASLMARAVEGLDGLKGEELKKAQQHLKNVSKQVKKAAKQGNKEALRFLNINGEPDIRGIALAYSEFVDLYSTKENIQFMQKASEKQLYDVKDKISAGKKLSPEEEKFVGELLERNISLAFSKNTTVMNGTAAREIAVTEIAILYPDAVDEDGKINNAEVVRLYNSVHKPPVRRIEDIQANAKAMQELEADSHINNLVDRVNTNTFVERTSEDLEAKEDRRKKLREDRKKEREEETEHAKDNPLDKIKRKIEKFRKIAQIEDISDALNELYEKNGIQDEYQSAVVASAYVYNRDKAFNAMKKGDGQELAEYEHNCQMIATYLRSCPEQYSWIVDKDGKINMIAIENINAGVFGSFDMTSTLRESKMLPQDITEIFEDAQIYKSQSSLVTRGIFKTIKNSIKGIGNRIRPKKQLEAGTVEETVEKAVEGTVKRNLSQVEIEILKDDMGAEGSSILKLDEDKDYEIDDDDFMNQLTSLKNRGLTKNIANIEKLEARVAGQRVLSQDEISDLIDKLAEEGIGDDTLTHGEKRKTPPVIEKDAETFDDRLKVEVDEKAAVQKTQESMKQERAVLKVDIGTMKKMAFEICQKNEELNSVTVMINEMSVPELQELIDMYGNEQARAIELQDEKPAKAQEGMEI